MSAVPEKHSPIPEGGRFDYVRYDDKAAQDQALLKGAFMGLESLVNKTLGQSRPASLVMTKLEEAYMWCGKAIRDAQLARGGDSADQPKRSNE
jgi:hypothetical protein